MLVPIRAVRHAATHRPLAIDDDHAQRFVPSCAKFTAAIVPLNPPPMIAIVFIVIVWTIALPCRSQKRGRGAEVRGGI